MARQLPESSVLGRILLLQSGLEAAPDEQHIADMLVQGLDAVPGIERINLVAPAAATTATPDGPDHGATTRSFSLKTPQEDYGNVTLQLSAAEAFDPYMPFVENTLNLAALRIEKMRSQAQFRQANRQLEELASERNTQYRQLFEQMSEGVIYQDDHGRTLSANPAALQILGFDALEELQAKNSPWGHAVRENGTELRIDELPCRQALALGCPTDAAVIGVSHARTGKTVWLSVNSVPQAMSGTSTPRQVFTTFHDITDLMEQQWLLYRVSLALNKVHESAFLIGEDGRFIYVNDEACRALGYTREELLGGMGIPDIALGWSYETWSEHLSEISLKKSMLFEASQRTRHGRTIPVEINATHFEHRGDVLVLGLVRDISERKLAETALRENEGRMKLFIEHAPVALAMFDLDMRYMMASQRWLTTYRLEQQNLTGRSHYEVFPEITEKWKDFHRRGLRGQTMRADEDAFARADGSIQWLRWEIIPWHQANGDIGGIIIFTEDISQLKQSEQKVAEYVKQLEESMQGTLLAISNMVEQRDPYTAGHERRVGIIAADIAREMGWPEAKCMELQMIGLVHDIGKIGVPAEILTKPGRLTPVEYDLVQEHVEKGYEILKDVKFPLPIADIIRQHHERMDGSGYPQGLTGEQTLPEARILAVADVMESMASYRPYRPALGIDAALHEITTNRAILFDADAVDALLRLIEKGYQIPS